MFGAQALVLRGCPRATADLDVTVMLGDEPVAHLAAALGRGGFRLRFDDPTFVATTRVLPIVHRPTSFPIDVVLGAAGLEERFAAAAEIMRIGRLRVPVATSTHLVLMKVLAARPKDLEDATALLTARGAEIDHRELDQLARALAEALEDDAVTQHLREVRERAAAGLPPSALPTSVRKPRRRRP